MDELNKKVITTSFVVFAALVGFVFRILCEISAAWSGAVVGLLSQTWFSHGLPIGLALAVFVYLQTNKKIAVWADEVVLEVRKVVWPTKNQTVVATIYVCVFVMLTGLMFGVFDLISTWVVNKVINLG